MIIKIAIVYGLGGILFDPPSGERQLTQRLKASGHKIDVGASPYDYTASQAIHEFLRGADWKGIIGDSFGADYAPGYARSLMPEKVDFLAGFQPSLYASDVVVNGLVMLPKNVVLAHCIYDPNWLDTGGLGAAQYDVPTGSPTKLLTTKHRGAHPDDWGTSQNMIFSQVMNLLETLK